VPRHGIRATIGGASPRHASFALWCLVAVGCAQVTTEAPEDAIQPVDAVKPVVAVQTSEPADAATTPFAEHALTTPKPPSFAPVAEVGSDAEYSTSPGLIPTPAAPPIYAEKLDFSSLVARLRKTTGIGLRTKIAVKNESEDLLEQFRAYHAKDGITTLADLRRSYDSLFHKLRSLLQDADPPLARDIDRSQAAIWELLADPGKFSASELMAGA
jgi:hypothetical protein